VRLNGREINISNPKDARANGIGMVYQHFTLAPGMYANPPYDPLRDFVPVAKVADVPIVLTANLDAPFKTLRELVAYAKANPGKLSYASSGKGTPSQFEMELFKQAAGVNIVEVPYRNTAQALTDVIGGQLAMYPSALPLALPQLKAGKVRALALIDRQRTPSLPDVPTMAEGLDMPGYVATPLWYGFVAPAGTPRDVVARLNAEIIKAVQVPAVRERLVGLGAQLIEIPNDEFQALMKAEIDKATRLIKALGIRND
jgi:tripartite-type tricarboxylate transporter receptor subunit TctC